jgi:hypothetical protein
MLSQTLIRTECSDVKTKGLNLSQVNALLNLFWILDQSASQFYFQMFVLQSGLKTQTCLHSVLISFSINSHITALTCTAEALTNTMQMEKDSRNAIAAKLPGN